MLLCYTDGVTEAINAAEEPFGVARLTEIVAAHRPGTARQVLDAVAEALLAFTEGRPPFDDVTLVIVKRTAG